MLIFLTKNYFMNKNKLNANSNLVLARYSQDTKTTS